MYKLLLSSRYLRTRFIALASIISVMLGVATMIVVNSVMAGFRYEMRDRLHGLISDVVIESLSTDGASTAREMEEIVMTAAGEHIEAVAPTVEIYGMLNFEWNRQKFNRPCKLLGIDPEREHAVSPLREFLLGRNDKLDDEGNVTEPALFPHGQPLDWSLSEPAMEHRVDWLEWRKLEHMAYNGGTQTASENIDSPFYGGETLAEAAPQTDDGIINPFASKKQTAEVDSIQFNDVDDPTNIFGGSLASVDPNEPFPARIYIGEGLVGFHDKDETGRTVTRMLVNPGEDVNISTIKSGLPDPARFTATVVDVFKSGMSEFDSNLIMCNIEELQKVRGMIDPQTGEGSITKLKIKLKNYDEHPIVIAKLHRALNEYFPPGEFRIYTWEQERAPILQAVEVESAILNVLLFLIIAVAGFGILAIFYMIVVEKTRDIGILKALGANSRGVMSIFLSYGLSLGMVGSGVGVVIGLSFVYYINEIEDLLSSITGHKVFDEAIYYFHEIPTQVSPLMVFWVAFGAVAIAVLASVLPARRAARLDPVRALRYE